jgi:hypothetical protein
MTKIKMDFQELELARAIVTWAHQNIAEAE